MSDQIELVRNGGNHQRHSLAGSCSITGTTNNGGGSVSGPNGPMTNRQTTMNHEITLGTDQDPYNKPELVNTLKGRELGFFVIFYIFAVMCIVMAFEFFKPVFFVSQNEDLTTSSISPSTMKH